MTGEATAAYLADRLRDRVTVAPREGRLVGSDLEYADEVTLAARSSAARPDPGGRRQAPQPGTTRQSQRTACDTSACTGE